MPVEMDLARFEELVSTALDEIPPELAAQLDNVVVLVEDDPPAEDPDPRDRDAYKMHQCGRE